LLACDTTNVSGIFANNFGAVYRHGNPTLCPPTCHGARKTRSRLSWFPGGPSAVVGDWSRTLHFSDDRL